MQNKSERVGSLQKPTEGELVAGISTIHIGSEPSDTTSSDLGQLQESFEKMEVGRVSRKRGRDQISGEADTSYDADKEFPFEKMGLGLLAPRRKKPRRETYLPGSNFSLG